MRSVIGRRETLEPWLAQVLSICRGSSTRWEQLPQHGVSFFRRVRWRHGFTLSPFLCRNLDRAPIQIVIRFNRRSYAQIGRATLLYILYNTQCNPHAQRTPLCRGTPSCPIGLSRSRPRSSRQKIRVRKRALMPAQKKLVVWRQSEKVQASMSVSPLRKSFPAGAKITMILATRHLSQRRSAAQWRVSGG